jgi:hypothetical protein
MNDEIFKITKHLNRAASLKEMAEERSNDIISETKPYKIVEEYYEIIKELITAVMYADGFKTLSHKSLIYYIKENYEEFDSGEIFVIDELRKQRNNIVYYGLRVKKEFINNHKDEINLIIEKLKKIVGERLKE